MRFSDPVITQFNINITGSFTIEPIEKSLKFWFEKIDLPSVLNFVGFNQIFQQLLNPASEFNTTKNGLNVILIRLEDLLSSGTNLELRVGLFKEFLEAILNHIKNEKLLVVFCPPSLVLKTNINTNKEYLGYEDELENFSNSFSNLLVIKSLDFVEKYKLHDYYEPLGETIGNIPYNENFFYVASTLIARKIHAIYATPFKAIVVDCDNTLWKGVVGEDGANNVEINGAEKELQKFLLKQYELGVLICLCSKNVEEDVWDVFESNKNMILRKEHIAFYRINWLPKSKNIIDLCKEINIGLDTFVFIDDNPIECNEVRINVPSVLTIQKRLDTDEINYIINSWIFDKQNHTQEDSKRTEMYQIDAERRRLGSSVNSYSEFIKSLNINITTQPATINEVSRISQLSYRTNQFNTTNIKLSEEDVKIKIQEAFKLVLYTKLNDKFGDYGIVSALIATVKKKQIIIDNFLLSCRALGKGVEHSIISYIGKTAIKLGVETIGIRFIKSPKNVVVEKFLTDNFSSYMQRNETETIFEIPVNVASYFTFDPDNHSIHYSTKSEKTNINSITSDILSRNAFYYDIIHNFSDLQLISNRISSKKITPRLPAYCSKTEATLLKIWQEELQNPNINIDDNFFDVGGKSITIPSIIIQCIKQLNVNIKIVDLFRYPTVSTLANTLDNLHKKKENDSVSEESLINFRKQRERFKKFK